MTPERAPDSPAMRAPSARPAITTDAMLEALGRLYTPTYGDWELCVQHDLTEPTCPTASIRCEHRPTRHQPLAAPSFTAFGDTIQEAIDRVTLAAFTTLIERQTKPDTVPWSNPGDAPEEVAAFLQALDDWKECSAADGAERRTPAPDDASGLNPKETAP